MNYMDGGIVLSEKLILIDGNSVAYRAFFALPLLNNDQGIHTNAIYGFATMLNKILEEEKPSHILVAFDAGKTTFRHSTYKDYKGGRQKTPPELSEQFPYVRLLLEGYGIQWYERENYEADDIIGTYSKIAEEKKMPVTIVSGDKDLTQLSTPLTTVRITKKGMTDMEDYTPDHIMSKYGLTPLQIIDMKGLMGDASDNIPGVPGVGEKTAIKLLKEHGSVEKILNSIDGISGKKLKEKLEENKEQAIMSKELATIYREVPLETEVDQLKYNGIDQSKLTALFKELKFQSLLDKMGVESEDTVIEDSKPITFETLNEIPDEILISNTSLHLEMLEDNYHTGTILGFGLVNNQGQYFIPTHVALSSSSFKKWAENNALVKSVFDAKKTKVALYHHGIELMGIDFDLLIASYILNPSESGEDFAELVLRHGFKGLQKNETVYGKGAKLSIPEESIYAEHVVRKAMAIHSLKEKCMNELEENDQGALFTDLELPLAVILGEMEAMGVRVDTQRLEETGQMLLGRLAEIEKKIHEYAGETFNVNSPKQLGTILFEKLNLPALKENKNRIFYICGRIRKISTTT